jgi:hypothetical protein
VILLTRSLLGQDDPVDFTPRQARVYIALLYGMALAVLLLLAELLTQFAPLGGAALAIWVGDPLIGMYALAGSISRSSAYDSLARRGSIWLRLLAGIYLGQSRAANRKRRPI